MPIIDERVAHLPDAAATLVAGARLARGFSGGIVVSLSGELGSGKTTLVRGMLHELGWLGPVKSPTYTLVETYLISSLYFYHFDFYRVSDPGEWETGGFADYFRPDAICVIEWPERVAGRLPVADVACRMELAPIGRLLAVAAHTASGEACLAPFLPAVP